MQRYIGAVGDGWNIDQNQLVIAAFGEFFRAEYFGVRAHQVEQNRQQAQALAIDDDPQLQIEPVAVGGFVNMGVPVFNRAQVKPEILVDLQFPALLAQAVHLVEGEVQPRAVIDHFKQFTGALGQCFALARGNFETQCAQLFAVAVFSIWVALDAQRVFVLTNQDVSVFLPRNVMFQVVERQRCPVLDVALHFAVARFKGAELGAGQPQTRHG